jgi:isopentenyl-diphosphate Delta-isomerase
MGQNMKAHNKNRVGLLPHRMPCAMSRPAQPGTQGGAGSCVHAARSGPGRSFHFSSGKIGSISRRKNEHISICLQKDVNFRKTNGFERYDFIHQALPELNLADIDTSTTFMGKRFSLPFFIEALTGGSKKAGEINRNLARAANGLCIGMGVGSQRAMLEDPELTDTYQVRETAPDILLLGNIGATQLSGLKTEALVAMVDAIGADGLAIHLNAAQEICQPGGDTDWRDVLANIERVCSQSPFPVVVKETGCGIDGQTARHLASVGVACIDIAGAGGTSFTKVEAYRNEQNVQLLGEWGIPTAESLMQCRQFVALPLIASGGIRNGVDCAKAIAMGASLVGFALPLLQAAQRSHLDVMNFLTARGEELKKAMFLIGARNIDALSQATIRSRSFG